MQERPYRSKYSDTASLEPALIANAPSSFLSLRSKLREIALKNFDFILIDCPPNMGTFVLCALYASDFAIVPIKAGSTFSVEGLIRAVELIKDVREKGNPNLRFLRLLINSIDRRTSISRAVTDQLENIFDSDKIFKTQIPVNTAFEKAESQRETVFQYDGTSSGARAFRELAKELSAILGA